MPATISPSRWNRAPSEITSAESGPVIFEITYLSFTNVELNMSSFSGDLTESLGAEYFARQEVAIGGGLGPRASEVRCV